MKTVYIDHKLIAAFFLANHPLHAKAVTDVASFLKNKDSYYCSPTGLFATVKKLTAILTSAKEKDLLDAQFEIEKSVVTKISDFVDKLDIKLLFTQSEHLLSKAISLQSEYKISIEVAYYTALMLEKKITVIATYDEGYAVLFSEGVLTKYQATS